MTPVAPAHNGNRVREALIDRLGREAFISLYVTANHFSGDIDLRCQAAGISHAQYTALWVLCLSDQTEAGEPGLPMGALVDGLLHRKADATRLVDRLVSQGLATRTVSAADRRVVLVSPTTKGIQIFESVPTEIKALHRQQWKALTNDELRTLTHLLNKALWSGLHDGETD